MAEKQSTKKGSASGGSKRATPTQTKAAKKALDDAKRAKGAGKKMRKDVQEKIQASKAQRAASAETKAEPDVAEKHAARIQPQVTDGTRRALNIRAAKKSKEPAFRRSEWFRYKKLSRSGWRKPFGLHNKIRRHFKYRINLPSVGFRGPAEARDLHPSGFREVLVFNVRELERVDPASEAVRIGGSVGTKKREAIVEVAAKRKIRVLNGGGSR